MGLDGGVAGADAITPLGPFLVICSGAAVDGERRKEHEGASRGKSQKKEAGACAWRWFVQQQYR